VDRTPTASTPPNPVAEPERPGVFRHLADDGRHLADPAVRFAGISLGIINAALVVIFTVAQNCVCQRLGSPVSGTPVAGMRCMIGRRAGRSIAR
jgi:hypothetical protein